MEQDRRNRWSRRTIRMGLEAAAILCLLVWSVQRFGREDSTAPGTEEHSDGLSRAETLARQKALLQSMPELQEAPGETAADVEELLAAIGEGTVFLSVNARWGDDDYLPVPWVLISEDLQSTNVITGRNIRFNLPVGTYRFAALHEDEFGDVWEARPVSVEVVAGELAGRMLVLQPVEPRSQPVAAPLPEPASASVGLVVRRVDQWLEVTRVQEGGGAARANLQAGDVLIEVNGMSADGLAPDEAQRLLEGPPGSTVEVVLALPEGEGWRAVPVQLTREP